MQRYAIPSNANFTDELFDQLTELAAELRTLEHGWGAEPADGIDYSREMAIAVGGTLLNELIVRLNAKVDCASGNTTSRPLISL